MNKIFGLRKNILGNVNCCLLRWLKYQAHIVYEFLSQTPPNTNNIDHLFDFYVGLEWSSKN